ncbi:hypothetical protein [Legionella sainthelensi]|uniref:Uncharacterized protein n=1 Tax=Legionella sainthelensi TaxID=28087 RepID=A0A2H5FH81_9GAMM|nr:hypothetical protein [Legionella sainthelensi]AUH70908.1 hypothetical protein CAB17_01700 [Legionella sainthelensi]
MTYPALNTSKLESQVFIRQLTAKDEEEFIKLLYKVYGNSYSYTFLYESGGLSTLIHSNKITSYGEFDLEGRLLAHTAFWHKEKNGDYVESGCSFRVSGGVKKLKSTVTPKAWHNALQQLATQYHFVHQHNSTLHLLAQRYATRLMNAKYCGLILGYAENEAVKGVKHQTNKMHALLMTTVLQPQHVEKKIFIPALFKPWLENIYQNLGLPRIIHSVYLYSQERLPFHLKNMEINPYIGLQRRLVQKNIHSSEFHCPPSTLRTDLIHLPLEDPELVHVIFPILIQSGYIPCGVRPHTHQSDELIFQNVIKYKQILMHLPAEVKIANASTLKEVEQWQKLVLQIM